MCAARTVARLGSAPPSSSAITTGRRPPWAAMCRGVNPSSCACVVGGDALSAAHACQGQGTLERTGAAGPAAQRCTRSRGRHCVYYTSIHICTDISPVIIGQGRGPSSGVRPGRNPGTRMLVFQGFRRRASFCILGFSALQSIGSARSCARSARERACARDAISGVRPGQSRAAAPIEPPPVSVAERQRCARRAPQPD